MAKPKAEVAERVRQDPLLERLLLGAIIASSGQESKKKRALAAMDILTGEDFFFADHRHVFAAMLGMRERQQEIDLVSLYTEIEKLGDLEGESLLRFLSTVGKEAHEVGDLTETVRELRRLTMCRTAARVLETAKMAILTGEEAVQEILDTTVEQLSDTLRRYEEFDQQGVTYYDASIRTVRELGMQAPIIKIFTGVHELDLLTGGFRPGELVIVTAETGSGKTLLAQQTRAESCRRGYISLFCSGEMLASQLMRRELAAAADVKPALMRREDELSAADIRRLTVAAAHQCQKCRILDGELSIGKIRRVARAMQSRHGLHLLILDYDELIESPGKDENEQLRRLVRISKSIGIELGCAVLLISQLRKEHGDGDAEPSLGRLYGSGAKTKHASMIIFAERKWQESLSGEKKDAVLWVLKNRDGKTGKISCQFNLNKLRFENPGETAPDEQGSFAHAT